MEIRLKSILARSGCVLGLFYFSCPSFADDIDMTTLQPAYSDPTLGYVLAVSPYFAQSVSHNSLAITSNANLPSTQYFITQNLTPFQISGNFVASVTSSATQQGERNSKLYLTMEVAVG